MATNSEIDKYLEQYTKDPKSRVFAMLAEAYRKAKMVDEAITVCKEGLKNHPNYLGGIVALGRAFFDKGMDAEAKAEMDRVLKIAPDNIVAIKTIGLIHRKAGAIEDARKMFKILVLMNPKDKESKELMDSLDAAPAKAPAAEQKPPAHTLTEKVATMDDLKATVKKEMEAAPAPEPEKPSEPEPAKEEQSPLAPVQEQVALVEPVGQVAQAEPVTLHEPELVKPVEEPQAELVQAAEPLQEPAQPIQEPAPEKEQPLPEHEQPVAQTLAPVEEPEALSTTAPVGETQHEAPIGEQFTESYTDTSAAYARDGGAQVQAAQPEPVQPEPVSAETAQPKEDMSLLDGLASMITDESSSTQGSATGFEVKQVSEAFQAGQQDPQMNTATMADLYFKQGHLDKALAIYVEIATKDPSDTNAMEWVKYLKDQMGGAGQGQVETKVQDNIKKLDDWLKKLKK